MTRTFISSFLAISFITMIISCKDNGATPNTTATTSVASTTSPSGDKIVFVDIDTLLTRSDLYKEKKADLEGQQKVAEKAIAGKIQAFQSRSQRFQQEVAQIQQKAATIAPVELKKLEEKYMQQEANLAKEQEALYGQRDNAAMELEKKLTAAQLELKKNIDDYLAKLAKEKGYELILIKGSTGAVMYGDTRLDITEAVVDQLNIEYKAKNKK